MLLLVLIEHQLSVADARHEAQVMDEQRAAYHPSRVEEPVGGQQQQERLDTPPVTALHL
jgi:hypothetical protein